MDGSYLTIAKNGDAVIEVKRSKFIGALRTVRSAQEAEAFLASERKKYHDAKHHCSAYVIRGAEGAPDIVHSSDDGEPSGTAGKPMLEVLNGAGLKDVVLVVTRYFGGTLLGTGGLVRAYTDAAKAAAEDAGTVRMALMQQFTAAFDYKFTGSIDHFIEQNGISRPGAEYTDRVRYELAVSEESYEAAVKSLTEITSSAIEIVKGEAAFVPV